MKTYTLNGTQVFLARTSDIEASPLKTCDEIGAYNIEDYNGCDTLLTLDDAECGTYSEGEPIMLAECVRPSTTTGHLSALAWRTQSAAGTRVNI